MAVHPWWALAFSLLRFPNHTRLDTAHSVGLLWTSDWPVAEIPLPDNTQHSHETDINASGWVRTRNPNPRGAADSRLRPRGHWDRIHKYYYLQIQPAM